MNDKSILNYVRSKLTHLFDPTNIFREEGNLRKSCNLPHKGCYIGIIDAADNDILREGFMEPKNDNILDSVDICIENVFRKLKTLNFLLPQLTIASVIISIVEDCIYLPDPLQWDINNDGIWFQWGDKYRGLYLPYQIRRMNLRKVEILDRLVGYECQLACSCWRLPEGLCFGLRTKTIN